MRPPRVGEHRLMRPFASTWVATTRSLTRAPLKFCEAMGPAGSRLSSLKRVGVDEWTVEYKDGEQAWRDHHELRPAAG